jgi:hemolysin activation/secretion protein
MLFTSEVEISLSKPEMHRIIKGEQKSNFQNIETPKPPVVSLPAIQGLRFVNNASDIKPDIPSSPLGVVIEGFTVPAQKNFIKEMQSFLGKQLTLDRLEKIKEKVTEYYWEKGYSLMDVKIPSNQDVSSGNVQFIILTAKLGKVKVEGTKYSSETRIQKEIKTKEGQEISSTDLLEDVTWLEYDPFRSIDIIYETGEKLGTTDIVLRVKDKFPLRVYSGYENSSYKIAGPSRWKIGFNLGHLFWQDHQFNAEVNSANTISRWASVNGSYIIPLPWRNILKFYGTFIHSHPTADELRLVPGSDSQGKFWQVGMRYELKFKNWGRYSHLMDFGYDFKRSNDFLDLFGETSQTYLDISQFLIRYEGSKPDNHGSSTFGVSFYLSPGGMSRYNHDKYFEIQRAGAHSNYCYGIFNIDRVTTFSQRWMWLLSFVMQLTSGKLLPMEEFSIGGHLSGRGYLENEVIGDRAILLKNELRFPSVTLNHRIKDELQLLAFIDFGYLNNVDKDILSRNNATLLSIGPGIRYKVGTYVDIRFDYGFQLKSVYGLLFGEDIHSRGHFGAFLTY